MVAWKVVGMSDKTFDCVEMKDEIQRRLLAELRDLPPEEQRRRTEEIIGADPLLARVWQRARRIGPSDRAAPAP